jgi:hypothetical protein
MLGQQTMKAGDPDVVEAIDRISHDFRRNGRLFGYGEVGRARGGNENRSAAGGDAGRAKGYRARLFVK